MLIEVALAVPLHRLFHYTLPENTEPQQWQIGCRVRVPFGSQQRVGLILGHAQTADVALDKLKPAEAILDQQPILPQSIAKLIHWAAKYYAYPLGDAMLQALPAALRKGEPLNKIYQSLLQITDKGRAALSPDDRAVKQQHALQLLQQQPLSAVDLDTHGISASIRKTLRDKGYIDSIQQPPVAQPHPKHVEGPQLNTEQSVAVASFIDGMSQFTPYVLEGVTGSGKTEVYLHMAQQVLNTGKQVLILVPEIGLTPQTAKRFQQRLHVPVHLNNSGMNDTERLLSWYHANQEQPCVVLGTRSTIFSPLPKLGLLIIDEEHDASYKQQDSFRYHARDLALVRAQAQNCPVVLGSATPSLETLANLNSGRYRHLTLKQRAGGGSLPRIGLIDMRKQPLQQELAPSLLARIDEHLQHGHQVLVFLNRRGFAPVMLCHECGERVLCHQCDRPMTLHKRERRLRCHHCALERAIPHQCDTCGSTQLNALGQGTEQLEEFLKQKFAQARVLRIDRDTTRRKGQLAEYLSAIRSGEYNLLVGTQMLTKGHDFPDLTLVCVIDVDSALFSFDFRATERLAQLMTQVAGRAGRSGKAAEVLLQSHVPEHPTLHSLISEPYHEFAQQQLTERRQTQLPPSVSMVLLQAESKQNELLIRFLSDLAQVAQISNMQAIGPMPCSIERKGPVLRWQLMLSHSHRGVLQQRLPQIRDWIEKYEGIRAIKWTLDVDPQQLA